MSDANILATLSEGDSSEIVEAKTVLKKAKSSEVKAFANMMISDHSRLKKDGEALAKKINVAPQPPANDHVISDLNSEMQTLSSENGSALDSEYMSHAVQDHEQDLNELKSFASQAQNPQLKDAINKAIPVVQKHLDRAQAIMNSLHSSTASTAKKR